MFTHICICDLYIYIYIHVYIHICIYIYIYIHILGPEWAPGRGGTRAGTLGPGVTRAGWDPGRPGRAGPGPGGTRAGPHNHAT